MDRVGGGRNMSKMTVGRPTPLTVAPGLRLLAVAAATEQPKKTGKKHPGKAILAGQYTIEFECKQLLYGHVYT